MDNPERIPVPPEIPDRVLEIALSEIADFRGSHKEAKQVFREFYKAAVRYQHRLDNPQPGDLNQVNRQWAELAPNNNRMG